MNIHYYGLPPEEGFTYALYLCPECGFNYACNRGQEIYCPSCGSVANFTQELPESELPQGIRKVGKCNTCTSILASSAPDADLQNMGSVFCPQCGSAAIELDLAAAQSNQQQQQSSPATAGYEYFFAPTDLQQTPQADKETEIIMTLHRCPEKGPFWNIIVDGNPVARVYLKDQSRPEELQEVFTSDSYQQALRQAMAQFGIQEALASVNAKFYAIDENKVREKVEAELRQEYEQKFNARVLKLKDEFKEAVAIALAGMNKNIWPDLENHLKAALYSELVRAGVEKPTRYIEAAFERSADQFFNTVLEKAMEIMAKPQEVRAEIKQLVATASVSPIEEEPKGDLEELSSEEVKARLVRGNFAFVPPKDTETSAGSVGDWKAAFRQLFRK